MKTIGLFLQEVFEWLFIFGVIAGGVWATIALWHFIYKITSGTYHLLDKLIDHL